MSQSNRPKSLRAVFTNMAVPIPLTLKLYMVLRNGGRRIVTGSSCCGHPGEPGC